MEKFRDVLNEAVDWQSFAKNSVSPDAELEISNVGYYTLYQLGEHTVRTRFDYLLFYIDEGNIQATFHGVPTILSAKTFLLYKPGELQDYAYLRKVNTKVYWIHFYGRAFDAIVHDLQLDRQTVYQTDNLGSLISSTIKQIYFNYSSRTESGKYSCIAKLIDLLSQISVVINPHINVSRYDFSTLISQMNKSYGSLSIEQCADLCHMSPFHFARTFKACMGISPHAFQIQLKLQYARLYLKNSSMSIAEIADILNFESPSYFCTFFKKQAGISPTDFRNS